MSLRSVDLQQLNQQAGKSVVLLKVYDAAGAEAGQGTGFVVEGGLIVTNHHVAEGASRMEALTGDPQTINILSVLADDEKNDLAILLPALHRLAPLPLSPRNAEVGERIVVLGNPLGLSGTLSEGIVSALRPEGVASGHGDAKDTGPLIQISAPISAGSSGSPVMDLQGNVVGVVNSSYEAGQNLNFAIPVAEVAKLMTAAKGGKLTRPLQTRDTEKWVILRNVIISIVFFSALIIAMRFVFRERGESPGGTN